MANATMAAAIAGAMIAAGPPFALAAPAADELATGKMLVDACAGCHGTDGNSAGPAMPSIAAMDPLVFVDTMTAFAHDDTYSTVMGRVARGYTQREYLLMGEYLHGIAYKPAAQAPDQTLVQKGAKLHERYCENCHEEGGKPIVEDEDYYILAGQWTPYLKYAMSDFREHRRHLPRKMGRKLDDMLAAEGAGSLNALYAFYAAYADAERDNDNDNDNDNESE